LLRREYDNRVEIVGKNGELQVREFKRARF